MNDIKGFTFYKSYYESLKNLKKNDKNELINAIFEYVFEEKMPNFNGIKKTIWTLIEPNLNTSKNRSNPNAGAPYGNSNASKEKQSKNNQKTINDLYDKDKDKDKDKERENKREKIVANATPPTLAEIISYANELNINDEKYCKKFYNYYDGLDWINGTGQKIKNWKSIFRNWIEKDNIQEKQENKKNYL